MHFFRGFILFFSIVCFLNKKLFKAYDLFKNYYFFISSFFFRKFFPRLSLILIDNNSNVKYLYN